MAHHASALKRMRQNEVRRARNAAFRSRVKTAIRKYLRALDEKSPDTQALLSQAVSLLHKGASKGIYHKNTASRKIARLSVKLSSPASS